MTYIHPYDKRIDVFIKNSISDRSDIKTISNELLAWFDKNVEYSRLNAPFFPLQRSDLDGSVHAIRHLRRLFKSHSLCAVETGI